MGERQKFPFCRQICEFGRGEIWIIPKFLKSFKMCCEIKFDFSEQEMIPVKNIFQLDFAFQIFSVL